MEKSLDDSIEWDTASALRGVNAGDRVNHFLIPVSLTFDILTINSTNNVGIPGVWMFQIDTGKSITSNLCAFNCVILTCAKLIDKYFVFFLVTPTKAPKNFRSPSCYSKLLVLIAFAFGYTE